MKEVVIAGYLRTAQSRSRPNDPARDWFCKMRGDELVAKLLPELIKRTGIEPKEIDDFLADQSPQAYERMVDRYLASRHYGEGMARHWLDVARYADTHGIPPFYFRCKGIHLIKLFLSGC